jgi:hypothetical protein
MTIKSIASSGKRFIAYFQSFLMRARLIILPTVDVTLRAIQFDVSWLFLLPWVLLLFFEVFRHLMQFSTGPHLNAMDAAGNPIKAMDWQPGETETALFYCLSLLLVVHLIQRRGMVPWTKVAFSMAVFLGATVLPLTVDFFFLHAGFRPIYWIVLAQVVPLALPFICGAWLASVTRNIFWFLAAMTLVFPVVSWLEMRADFTMDDAEQVQPGPWNTYLTQGFLASWTCGIGLAIATTALLFAKSVRVGWVLGVVTLAVSFCILVGWSRAYPSLIYRYHPPIPIAPFKLPSDYFKQITWEPDEYGECDWKGNYTRMAYAELNRIPTDDGPFPVINSIQAKFILADGQSFDLWPPQVTYYFETTITEVFAQRYPGLTGGGKFPLFRFTHDLREKLRGKNGTLVLTIDGRIVKLEKRAEVSLREGKSERLNFANGTALVWQGRSMRESWTNLQIAARSY